MCRVPVELPAVICFLAGPEREVLGHHVNLFTVIRRHFSYLLYFLLIPPTRYLPPAPSSVLIFTFINTIQNQTIILGPFLSS